MLYYGLEVYPITNNQIKSLNYVLHSTFSKIFKTKCHDIVNECMSMFNCPNCAEETVHKKNLKFFNNYAITNNVLCLVCHIQCSVPS